MTIALEQFNHNLKRGERFEQQSFLPWFSVYKKHNLALTSSLLVSKGVICVPKAFQSQLSSWCAAFCDVSLSLSIGLESAGEFLWSFDI